MGQYVGGDVLAVLLQPVAHAWWFAPACSLLIIAAAAWAAATLVRRLRGPRASLAKAGALIAETHTRQSFAAAFPVVDSELSRDPFLRHAWVPFRETVLHRSGEDTVKYTVRPRQFLNGEALAGGVVNLAMIRAMPNYLVGVGLLFTFVGLVAALYFAGLGVTAQDIHDAQASLKQLLQAATFKFVTSIAGLGASILFSIAKKRQLGSLARQADQFCRLLEERLELLTPVAVAHASHRELMRFNTELGQSIATHLDATIGRTMGSVMAPMGVLLERMTENMAEMNREAIERMLLMFTERLQGAAAQEMARLIDALRTVHASIAGLVGDIDRGRKALSDELTRTSAELGQCLTAAGEAAGERMVGAGTMVEQRLTQGAQAVDASVTRFAAAADGFEAVMGRSTTAFGNQVTDTVEALGGALAPLAAGLDALQSGIGNMDAEMARQRDSLAELMGELQGTVTALRQASTDVSGAAQPLAGITTGMEEGMRLLAEAGERLGGLNRDFAGLSTALAEASGTLSTAWKGTDERFGALDGSLEKVFEQLQRGLASYRDGVADFVTEMDSGMTRSVGLLGGAVGELSDVVESLSVWQRRAAEGERV